MPRCSNWPEKLYLFIEEKRSLPFDWQTNNCAFFACDWLAVCFGVDPAAPYRKLTAVELARLVRSTPLNELAGQITTAIGWPQVKPARAHRGDIVEMPMDGHPALGVCLGAVSAFVGKDGLLFLKTSACTRAWRVD